MEKLGSKRELEFGVKIIGWILVLILALIAAVYSNIGVLKGKYDYFYKDQVIETIKDKVKSECIKEN